jgi:acetyltransferase-like isoleucine patch superfamily enzyme
MNSYIYQTFSQFYAIIPGIIGDYFRKEFYNMVLEDTHMSYILFGTIIANKNTKIGRGVGIGGYSIIGYCEIGEGTAIGNGVHIISGKKIHDFDSRGVDLSKRMVLSKISIGEKSWIGNQSIIMANIGRNCLIGAGSVVNKDIEEGVLAAGNPAKVIKRLG